MRAKILAVCMAVSALALLIIQPVVHASPGGGDDYVRWSGTGMYAGVVEGTAYVTPGGVSLWGGHGTWTSPVVRTTQPIDTLNPSWQAGKTSSGASVAVELRVKKNDAWSTWYKMGLWGFENAQGFTRTSINGQSDAFGTVYTDTYVNTTEGAVQAYQVRAHLKPSGHAKPVVRQLAVQAAAGREFAATSPTTMRRQIDLPVPQFSQYVLEGAYPQYGGGGEAWCSPTSVAMVLKYYGRGPSRQDIAALPSDSVFDGVGRVNGEAAFAAVHTYDTAYEGTGNWPFNTAYAAHYGIDSAVRVYPDLRSVEAQIKQGHPVVVSIAWDNTKPGSELPGAGIERTNGHLMIVRGFTANGDVIANDPATRQGNGDVRRVYSRYHFERQWTNTSNGTAYELKG